MKKIIFSVLVVAVIFSACEKEEVVVIPTTVPQEETTTSFTCTIDGIDYDGSNTISTDLTSDFLTITSSEGESAVSVKVPGISIRNVGDEISFLGAIGYGQVISPSGTYWNTNFDASKGKIIITEIDLDNSKISGTFFFEAEDVATGSFVKVNVTSGEFTYVSF